jgi:formylglycine-generating enzyme
MRTTQWGIALGFAVVLAGACSSTGATTTDGIGGAAGTSGSSGTSGTGGNAGGSGSSGISGTGGVSGTGGTAGSGGTVAGGAGGNAGTDAGVFVPANAQSCAGGLLCNGESCCTSIVVPGGTFTQGGLSPDLARSSTVSTFALDKYEVTVGRFRTFVDAYVGNGVDGGTETVPAEGAGANPNIPVSPGSTANGTGWQSAWNASLPASQAEFKDASHLAVGTWTDTVGANESLPINYVNWYEAFAFCIWDGGWLPTESEWEYAAAGGAENRLYPWGSAAPDCTYANFIFLTPRTYCGPGGTREAAPVGSYPLGNGRWGHADFGGNMEEWNFDGWAAYPTYATTNYAQNQTFVGNGVTPSRVFRGGDLASYSADMRTALRNNASPSSRGAGIIGLRCARTAQ